MVDDVDLTSTFNISEFYMCRNRIDCERTAKCPLCQRAFIMEGAK
jgi:hypothetical protein